MVIIRNEICTFEQLTRHGMETLKQASNQILNQLIELAGSITDEQFNKELPVLLQNSIGRHYRHIIEFYGVMLEGFHTGKVNYDNRKHDPELERSREKCFTELQRLKSSLLGPVWQDPMELAGSYSKESEEVFKVSTNAERELVYNIEHAVHHMAIIRIAIQHEFPELPLKDEFGYAISTLKHLRKK